MITLTAVTIDKPLSAGVAIVIPDNKQDVDIMVTALNRACNTWHPNPPPELLVVLDQLKEIQKTFT